MQAQKCHANIKMSCKHKNVMQAQKCHASIQMSCKHPNVRQKSNVRQSPDMPQCLKICYNAPKYATMPPKCVTFGPTFLIFFVRPKIAHKGPPGPRGALGAMGGPISAYFCYFFLVYPIFPRDIIRYFSFYDAPLFRCRPAQCSAVQVLSPLSLQ